MQSPWRKTGEAISRSSGKGLQSPSPYSVGTANGTLALPKAAPAGNELANHRHNIQFAAIMRAIIQRVLESSVKIEGQVVSKIGPGLLVLLGIEEGDAADDIAWLSGKIARMRIFGDAEGKMNLSITELGGEIIVVSQFTLHASTKKGNRPSFLRAAPPALSEPLYQEFCSAMEGEIGIPVGRGIFGADMKVSLVNDGPVTLLIDSRARE
jgi:D-tyrosyl-tRNA(Tyr) deacylase